MEAKILDPRVLLNVAPEQADRHEILRDFIAETRSDIAELERSLEANDFPESVRLAHCIKGASAVVGADELAQICATIERLGRLCVPQTSESAKAAFDRLTAHLDAEEWGNRWP